MRVKVRQAVQTAAWTFWRTCIRRSGRKVLRHALDDTNWFWRSGRLIASSFPCRFRHVRQMAIVVLPFVRFTPRRLQSFSRFLAGLVCDSEPPRPRDDTMTRHSATRAPRRRDSILSRPSQDAPRAPRPLSDPSKTPRPKISTVPCFWVR